MQVSTDDAPLSSDHLSVGVSDQSSARISDQPSLNAAQLSIRINDQSTIRSTVCVATMSAILIWL